MIDFKIDALLACVCNAERLDVFIPGQNPDVSLLNNLNSG